MSKQIDANTTSLTPVSTAPSDSERQQGAAAVQAAQTSDPAGFAVRTKVIYDSPKTLAYLKSFRGLDLAGQVSGLAAVMPTDVLTGFTEMIENGSLEFHVKSLGHGVYGSEMITHKPSAIQARDLGSLPRCASAWTAFWAWFAVTGVTCGAFAPFPPAAFACAAGFAVGGAGIDFNTSCQQEELSALSHKSRYWLTLSALLGAGVIAIGFAPIPMLIVLGAVLVLGFLATGFLYGQWQPEAVKRGAMAAPLPVISAIVSFNLAVLLRGSDLAGFLVPALAIALFLACYLWSRKHGPYVQPPNSAAVA